MNEDLNELEIRQLERELRSYGDPYASPEPDARYFANFRARVMTRIAERPEAAGFMQRVSEFFFGSPMRMAFTGGSLVAGALLYFAMQSSTELPIAEDLQPKHELIAPQQNVEQNTVIVPAPEKQMAEPSQPVTAHKVQQPRQSEPGIPVAPVTPQNRVPETSPSENIAEAAAQFEQVDELSMSDESEPISYDKLSMEELEAVLKTLETEPLSIQ